MIGLGDGPFRPKDCQDIILAELRLAGVTNIITEEKEVQALDAGCPAAQTPPGIIIPSLAKSYHPETHFRMSAKLHGWEIMRAWTYWVVRCEKRVDEIAIKDATALFEEHGREMRVDGHCGCPRPEKPWLKYHARVDVIHLADGKVLTLDGKFLKYLPAGSDTHWIPEFELLNKVYFGESGGMDHYHIDTQDAFTAFCKYLHFRDAERKKAAEAYRKEQIAKGNWKWNFEPQLDGFIPEKEFSMALISEDVVHELMRACLFTDLEQMSWDDPDKPPEDFVVVKGILRTFALHRGRLENIRGTVKEILLNLPRTFMKSVGGGHSFLDMPSDKEGNRWGEQPTAEALLVLGIGLGLAEYCAPRSMWGSLPGRVPYIAVIDAPEEPAKKEEPCPKTPEKNESPSSPSAPAASEAATTAPGENS